jgi:hypothetical protein
MSRSRGMFPHAGQGIGRKEFLDFLGQAHGQNCNEKGQATNASRCSGGGDPGLRKKTLNAQHSMPNVQYSERLASSRLVCPIVRVGFSWAWL